MFSEVLPFVVEYVQALSEVLKREGYCRGLSTTQQRWLGYCLTAILVTGTVCWAAFARAGLGDYGLKALSWMFRRSSLPWPALLDASTTMLMARLGLTHGTLSIDDTDHERARFTPRIHATHTVHDKKTGGHFNGQCLVVLLLITDKVTLPVGFRFHQPDPAVSAWRKQYAQLTQQGVPPKDRPRRPAPNPAYPSKGELALELIAAFHRAHPKFQVQAVVADTWFGTKAFLEGASHHTGGAQVVSQVRSNQAVIFEGQRQSVSAYFAAHPATVQRIRVRGGAAREVEIASACLMMPTHGAKRLVVAMKYKNEAEFRYLVASDLTWRALDIVQCYTLRWLVETFFEDWKLHEGWATMAKQPDEKGSHNSVILSLLFDHAMLHPSQATGLP